MSYHIPVTCGTIRLLGAVENVAVATEAQISYIQCELRIVELRKFVSSEHTLCTSYPVR